MADGLDPRLSLVVHVEALLGVLGTLLDIAAVLAADHSTDVADGASSLLGVVGEMSGLATTSHAGDTLSSISTLLGVLGTLFDLRAVRNPAGEILSLTGPVCCHTSTAVCGLSPVGLRGRRSTLKRQKLSSLERGQLNGSVGKRSIKSLLEKSSNVLRLGALTNDDRALNVDGEAFLLDLLSLGLDSLLGISSLGLDLLGDLLGTILDSLSIDSVGVMAVVTTVVTIEVTVSRVAMRIVGVAGVRVVVGEVREVRGELAMGIKERHTIGPHTVELEVLSDVDLVKSGFDVVHHAVVMDGTVQLKLVHNGGELSTDLLKVVSSEAALLVKSLEVDKALSSVVQLVHKSVLVLEVMLMKVGHAEGEVVDGRVEHLSDGSNEVLVVVVLVIRVDVVMSVESSVSSRVEVSEISKVVDSDSSVTIITVTGDVVGSGVMHISLMEVVLVGAGVVDGDRVQRSVHGSVVGVVDVVVESQVSHSDFEILL